MIERVEVSFVFSGGMKQYLLEGVHHSRTGLLRTRTRNTHTHTHTQYTHTHAHMTAYPMREEKALNVLDLNAWHEVLAGEV